MEVTQSFGLQQAVPWHEPVAGLDFLLSPYSVCSGGQGCRSDLSCPKNLPQVGEPAGLALWESTDPVSQERPLCFGVG